MKFLALLAVILLIAAAEITYNAIQVAPGYQPPQRVPEPHLNLSPQVQHLTS